MRIEREREEDREEAAHRGGQASGIGHYKRSKNTKMAIIIKIHQTATCRTPRRGKRRCAGTQCLDGGYDKMALPSTGGPIEVRTILLT